jgi:hypothetical protein
MSLVRAVPQAVARRLPTSAYRVHARVTSSGQVDKVALGQVSSEYFGFPCHTFIPLIANDHLSSRGSYDRPISGLINSGLGYPPTRYMNKRTSNVHKDRLCRLLVRVPSC